MKRLKFVLAAQNIDGWLNIFHGWLEFVVVLADLATHGCGFRVYLRIAGSLSNTLLTPSQ